MKTHADSYDDAGSTVEKAEADKVVINEFSQRKEDYLKKAGFLLKFKEFLGTQRGVIIDFFIK